MRHKNQKFSELTAKEQEVIATYRKLSPIQRVAFRAYFKYGDNRLFLALLNQGVHNIEGAGGISDTDHIQ